MRAIDRLYRKDENVVRSILIDQDLYKQVQYLSSEVFEPSTSRLVNVCIENTLLKNSEIKFYKKPKEVDSIYRSVVIRKTLLAKLFKLRDKTGISLNRLINGCIKEFLEEYKDELK
jgi:hypothetical protein